MKILLLALFASCTLPESDTPDASLGTTARVYPDHPNKDAAVDAAPVECFTYRQFQCKDVIYNLCVPYGGCSEPVRCRGKRYAYCYFVGSL